MDRLSNVSKHIVISFLPLTIIPLPPRLDENILTNLRYSRRYLETPRTPTESTQKHRDEYKSPFHVATACARRTRESACKFQCAVLSRLIESINRAAPRHTLKMSETILSGCEVGERGEIYVRNGKRRRRRPRRKQHPVSRGPRTSTRGMDKRYTHLTE